MFIAIKIQLTALDNAIQPPKIYMYTNSSCPDETSRSV